MTGYRREWGIARGLAITFLAAVVVVSFAMVVITSRSAPDVAAEVPEPGITRVSADQYELLSLDADVPLAAQLSLDLCGAADTDVRCFSALTKKPWSASPSAVGGSVAPHAGSGIESPLTPRDLQEAYYIADANGDPGTGPTVAVVVAYGYDVLPAAEPGTSEPESSESESSEPESSEPESSEPESSEPESSEPESSESETSESESSESSSSSEADPPAEGSAGAAGSGVTPTIAADLAAFRAAYGLGDCDLGGCLTVFDQRGDAIETNDDLPSRAKPAGSAISDAAWRAGLEGWATETALDLDMVAAACPSCDIALYIADSANATDMMTAVAAASNSAQYVSMSWGVNANQLSAEGVQTLDSYLDEGSLYFAASGDDGYGAVEYPSLSSGVIGVGGTALHQAADTARGWREVAWTGVTGVAKKGGPGSGCTDLVDQPEWQQAVVGDACGDGAAIADVSAVASHATPVAMYYGGWYAAYGTSAAAPLVAGIYASAGAAEVYGGSGGVTASALAAMYGAPGRFSDVVAGSNGQCDGSAVCTAGEGWDGPTGVGSPIGTASFDSGADLPDADGERTTPTVTVTGGSGHSDADGVITATVRNGAPSLEFTVSDVGGEGQYDGVRLNVTLAIADADGNAVPGYSDQVFQCLSTDLPEGLDLDGCVLSGMTQSLGAYAINVTKDEEGNLVVTVEQPGDPDPSPSPSEPADESPSPSSSSSSESTSSSSSASEPSDESSSASSSSSASEPPDESPQPSSSPSTSPSPSSSSSASEPADESSSTSASPSSSSSSSPSEPPGESSSTSASPSSSASEPPDESPQPSSSPSTSPSPSSSSSASEPADESTSSSASPSPSVPLTTAPAPRPPIAAGSTEAPRSHDKIHTVDVTIKLVLVDLVTGATGEEDGTDSEVGSSGFFGSVDPSGTILRDIMTPGRQVTQRDAMEVLSLLPPVVGLTPAYTPSTVMMIRAAQLLKAFVPIAF